MVRVIVKKMVGVVDLALWMLGAVFREPWVVSLKSHELRHRKLLGVRQTEP